MTKVLLLAFVLSATEANAHSVRETFVMPDVVRAVFGSWLPAVTVAPAVATTGKRRAVCFGCRVVEPPTLVKAGDVATFIGSHNVSGTATILDKTTIRVSGLRHDGSAPGLDFRIGLSGASREDFIVLRVTGRQAFQNATFDLTLPPGVTLNSFDTFTVWCYEFTTIIAEGKFQRP